MSDTAAILDRAEALVREMATALGQPALDVAMLAAQAQAVGWIGQAIVGVAGGAALGWLAYRLFLKATAADFDVGPFYVIGGAFVAVASFSLVGVNLATLTNVGLWFAAYDGRIALALKVLG
jgi:hypothetical protein